MTRGDPKHNVFVEGRQFAVDAEDVTATDATVNAGMRLPPEDLTSRNGDNTGEYATHDGTGTPDPGLYRWDGSAWVFVEGSSTI